MMICKAKVLKNMYEGSIDIFCEKNGDLKNYMKISVRDAIDRFNKGEFEPFNELFKAIDKVDQFQGQILIVDFVQKTVCSMLRNIKRRLEENNIELDEESGMEVRRVVDETFNESVRVYLLKKKTGMYEIQEEKEKDEKEKEDQSVDEFIKKLNKMMED